MRSPRQPLFLARQSYRRRRLADASRLLPLIGAVMLMLPLLWRGGGAPVSTAMVGLYLFSVWFGLIVAASLLARWLTTAPGAEPGADREGTE